MLPYQVITVITVSLNKTHNVEQLKYAVQGHSRSALSVPTESPYATSY